MQEHLNPYEAPKTQLDPTGADQQTESTRKAHLHTEASIKGIGTLYILIGSISGVVAMATAALYATTSLAWSLGSMLPGLLIGSLLVGTGFAIRRFKPWSRIAGTIFSAIGLIGFPIGTIFGAYFLYLMWCEKGRMIFAPAYQQVLAATPHIKYKTSIVIWIILGLVLALVAAAIVLPMIRSMR